MNSLLTNNLIQVLNTEDNTEVLRYEKVILATNADVDGMHIRNLMIAYFFRFFEQLVHDGPGMCWRCRCSAVLAHGQQQQGERDNDEQSSPQHP